MPSISMRKSSIFLLFDRPCSAAKVLIETPKKMRFLLNRISLPNFEEMEQELKNLELHNYPWILPTIADLLIEKCVMEPHFCPIYCHLLHKQLEIEKEFLICSQKTLRRLVIRKCQFMFDTENIIEQDYGNDVKVIEEVEEEKELWNVSTVYVLTRKDKKRFLGIVRLISQLFCHGIIGMKIIDWCLVELLSRYRNTSNEVYLEYIVQMVQNVDLAYSGVQQSKVSEKEPQRAVPNRTFKAICLYLTKVKHNHSKRIRFMIMNLEEHLQARQIHTY
uniref:MIF4G domain-containing protein n=1 Tax=Ditylenchus dipsaci TaxID=166011 RepID=A0A915DJE9_9BILA